MKFFKNVVRSVVSASSRVAPAILFSSLFLASGADAATARSGHSASSHHTPSPSAHSSNPGGMYASIQYYGDFFTHMGDFKGKEDATGVTTSGAFGWNTTGDKGIAYDPDYITDYVAGGISVGYSMGNGLRAEIEGQYFNVEVDDADFKTKENSKYLELARKGDISGAVTTTGLDFVKKNEADFSITSEGGVKGGLVPNPVIALTDKDYLAVKFKNDGIRFMGGFVNVGYDIRIPGVPVTPFIVGGVGFAQTKFLEQDVYGLAYQAKAGVAYNMGNFAIFAGYDYRGTFSKEYKEVKPISAIAAVTAGNTLAPKDAVAASSTATVETTLGVHGLTAGVSFKF
jgi:hypothetical protein